MPQRPSECSSNGRGLFSELRAEVVQSSCVEHQRHGSDQQCQENIQRKLPDLRLRDEQPRRKKPGKDRIDEKLEQPHSAAPKAARKNLARFLEV